MYAIYVTRGLGIDERCAHFPCPKRTNVNFTERTQFTVKDSSAALRRLAIDMKNPARAERRPLVPSDPEWRKSDPGTVDERVVARENGDESRGRIKNGDFCDVTDGV
jgi:hypothetical protein